MAIHITQNTTNKLQHKTISASIIHGSAVGRATPASYVVDASDLQEADTNGNTLCSSSSNSSSNFL